MASQFSTLNGLIQGLGGFISIIASGILADRLEKRYPSIKSYIGIIGGALAIPAIIGATFFEGTNFYLSLAFLAFKFVISEGFMAPTIAMMQRTVKPEAQGSIVSAYLFFLTASGMTATIMMAKFCKIFGAASNPMVYGKLIATGSVFGLIGSIYSFLKAGKAYEKFKDDQE